MPSARIGPGGAAATHGPHGMHGFLTGTAAAVILAAAFVTGAEAVEVPTIPTAAAGVAAPRCTLGQPCTFAVPIFACNYAGAETITARGGEVGASLIALHDQPNGLDWAPGPYHGAEPDLASRLAFRNR